MCKVVDDCSGRLVVHRKNEKEIREKESLGRREVLNGKDGKRLKVVKS